MACVTDGRLRRKWWRERDIQAMPIDICHAWQIKTATGWPPGGLSRQKPPRNYMLSIMTWPKPEQLTWVAFSMRRAKS